MVPKSVTLLFVVLALVGIITFTSPAYAEVTSVQTNTAFYKGGDQIIFSGKIAPGDSPYVTVAIYDPNNKFVILSSGVADNNNNFQITVDTSTQSNQPKFTLKGNYNATAFIMNQASGKTISFTFSPDGSPVASSTTPTITVSTDKSSYNTGDIITISGAIKSTISGDPVTIQILNANNNLVSVSQIDVSQDGTYSETVTTTNPLWKSSGTYTVKVQYGPTVTAQTTFSFQNSIIPISSVFQVKDTTSQQIFNVDYTIDGGTVKDMTINHQNISLIVTLSATSDGSITLQLPRSLIDAKTNAGQDDKFVVLIDGAQVVPQNEQTSINERTMTVQFLQGDQNIQIIGTNIENTLSPAPTITVSTDKSSYNYNDQITVSGTVSDYISGTPVSIIVRDPTEHVIQIAQVDVGTDKTYSTTISANTDLWQTAGTYEIDVQYGSASDSAKTTFQFSGSNGETSSGNTIKVDGTDFAVTYSITNGKVLGIKADSQSKSLITSIQTTGDGQLTIDLPRALIDAKKNDQIDNQFFVLNNGQQAQFTETETTTDRTLTIPFISGTPEIEIIGTQLVGGTSESQFTVSHITIPNFPHQIISLDNVVLDAEIADTQDRMTQGLQYQDQLSNNQGMLFVLKSPQILPIWMINMKFPLDIIWFDSTGNVIHIEKNVQPCYSPDHSTCPVYNGGGQIAEYVLEVTSGFVDKYSITLNSKLSTSTSVFTPTQQDIQNINEAKANQTIAAEVNVGANQSQTTSIDSNVSVQTTINSPDSLESKVSAPDQTGPKVIMFNLPATTINVANLKDLGVMYDGKLISPAPNMDAILHAKSTDSPSFAIVVTQSGVQVLVLIPHFSTHTITIVNMTKVIPAVPEFGSITGMIVIISVIGVLITSRKVRFHF